MPSWTQIFASFLLFHALSEAFILVNVSICLFVLLWILYFQGYMYYILFGGIYVLYIIIHWKRPWCWERLRAGGEEDDRGWDGWRASLTQWVWVWANSRRWWRIRRPSMLPSTGSQKVRHDWEIEQQMYNVYDISGTLDYFADVELWVFSFLMLRQVTNTEK